MKLIKIFIDYFARFPYFCKTVIERNISGIVLIMAVSICLLAILGYTQAREIRAIRTDLNLLMDSVDQLYEKK